MSSNLLIIHEIVSQDSQHNLKEAKALAKIYMRERERERERERPIGDRAGNKNARESKVEATAMEILLLAILIRGDDKNQEIEIQLMTFYIMLCYCSCHSMRREFCPYIDRGC